MTDKTMAAVNLDGLTYDAAPEVAKAFEKLSAELDTARTDAAKSKSDMQKEYDELKAKADALKEEMDKLKEDRSDAAIAAKVQERLSLEREAGKLVKDAKFDGLSDREVMLAAIQQQRENFDAEGKSDDYIKASFDVAIESAGDPEAIAKQRAATAEKMDGVATQKETMRGNQSRLDSLIAKSRGGQ